MFPVPSPALRLAVLCLAFLVSGTAEGQLEDVSVDHLVQASTAASWFGCGLSCADFDGDGWDDVTAATSDGPIELYRGGPDGLEHHLTLEHDVESKAVLWVDVDNDGDLDLVAGVLGVGLFLYMQEDDGSLIEDGLNRGMPLWPGWDVRGVSAVDYDKDDDLDLFVASYHDDMDTVSYENLMLRNDGGGFFSDQTMETGVGNGLKHTFQGAWFDYDEDGDQDLWIINDRAVFPNALYRNIDGVFYDIAEDVGANVAIEAMSATLCDPDNDGDWDMYMTNIENNPNVYQRNNDGVFTDVAQLAGVASLQYGWGTLAIDLDGDMMQDLMVATYRFPNTNPYDNHLYMNDGSGTSFTDEIENWPNEQYQLYCLGQLDLDNDRTPDIIGHGNAAHAQVLRNTNEDGASRLTLKLVGTLSNSHAVGALIHVWSGGIQQMRQVAAGCDYMTQHSYTQFFGCGMNLVVDSIQVRWPSGLEEKWYGLPANSALTLVEGTQDAALTAIEGECPWYPDRWVVPAVATEAELTWNGEPFSGDTLVADSTGTQVFEATWWDGAATWTSMVEAEFGEEPTLSVEGLDPACHGEMGSLVWSAPEAELVLWQADTLMPSGQVDSVGLGAHLLVAQIQEGCTVEAAADIESPDSLAIQMVVHHPDCFGETGSVILTSTGGTGPVVFDPGTLVLDEALPGVYGILATDSLGCLRTDSLEVVEPDSLVSSLSYAYFGISDSAQVDLLVDGGTPPYSIMWSGPIDEAGGVLAPVSLGWLVEDANGCLDLGVVQIASNPLADVPDAEPAPWHCLRDAEGIRIDTFREGNWLIELWALDGRLLLREEAAGVMFQTPLSGSTPVLIRMRSEATGEEQVWVR